MASIGETIRRRKDHILATWEDQAARAASARGLSRVLLRNVIPSYLDALVERERNAKQSAKLLERYLSARIREGFALVEILEELDILGRAIVRAANDDGGVDVEEVAGLLGALSRDAAAATNMFHVHMMESEQADKSAIRALQAAASETPLGERTTPMRERLTPILDVVRNAMHADSVSLLLFDRASQTLATAASVGPRGPALEAYGRRLGAATLTSMVEARGGAPITLDDVATTALDVGGALRESGIGSLLGVRLPSFHRLMGALYIGFVEPPPVTERTVARAELLGEQLTIHLYNAELSAELRATISEMETDRKLRDRLVSILAHDLRGPLETIRLQATMLKQQAAARDGALVIARCVDRTDRMVSDLLDTLLIRSGRRLPLEIVECDLVAIAADVLAELRALHGPRLALLGDASVVGFWSASDLRRAIWNLASNAVKYGRRDGPVSVTITAHGELVDVSVHNEGNPIPKERQQQLFQPFAQLTAAESGHHGWGLGLTLVQGTATAHGGRVDVISTEADGTTFTMHLPRDARSPSSGLPRARRD